MMRMLFILTFVLLFSYAIVNAEPALPQVSITSVPSIIPKVKGDQIHYNALQGTQFVVSAEDSAGINSILVKVDGNEFTAYTAPLNVPAGKHTIIAKAQNTAGLWSNECKVDVLVKDRRTGIVIGLCGMLLLIIAHLAV